MRALAAGLIAGIVLLPLLPARGQTPAIQKKIETKLKQAREQERKKAQANLEQLLAEALKNNPDLRVAQAKVRTAEAERDQLRLKLVQEVTVAHAELERARAAVAGAKSQLDAALSQFARAAVSQKDVGDAGAALQQAKATLAAVEAKLAYLVGKAPSLQGMNLGAKAGGDVPDLGGLRYAAAQALFVRLPKVDRTLAEKLRTALAAPFALDSAGGGLELKDALDAVRQKLKGINVVCPKECEGRTAVFRLTEAVPLGAALQLLEEEYSCRFLLRDYGIRVVDAQEAVPPGAVFLADFWKQRGGADRQKE
jgi:hypothetical protein